MGFAAAVGVAVSFGCTRRWAKLTAWGPLVAATVLATGNHYLVDVAAGLLTTAAGYALGLLVESYVAGRRVRRCERALTAAASRP